MGIPARSFAGISVDQSGSKPELIGMIGSTENDPSPGGVSVHSSAFASIELSALPENLLEKEQTEIIRSTTSNAGSLIRSIVRTRGLPQALFRGNF